jgi:hypothetical protein
MPTQTPVHDQWGSGEVLTPRLLRSAAVVLQDQRNSLQSYRLYETLRPHAFVAYGEG